MGMAKEQMMKEQDLGECPECGEQCEENDEGLPYCAECETEFSQKCDRCGCNMSSSDATTCSDCFSNLVNKD